MFSSKLLAVSLLAFLVSLPGVAKDSDGIFAKPNLVAWCIVPYDGKQRTPAQRAEMLERIGIKRYAYDWRDPHLPTFDTELNELAKRKIELTAVWFPGVLNEQARVLLDGIAKHKLKTQLWVTLGISDVKSGVDAITPIAREADKLGCTVGLYNHGGWFGEPEKQIAIIDELKKTGVNNVGIVYNLHHGHAHVDRFRELLAKMKPHLLSLNLNGMTKNGDAVANKILPLGQGELDLKLLKLIRESGYAGPIGILNHTDEDAEARLLDNIDGLDWLIPQLDGKPPASPKPTPRKGKL
jgi:hypothetical protein